MQVWSTLNSVSYTLNALDAAISKAHFTPTKQSQYN